MLRPGIVGMRGLRSYDYSHAQTEYPPLPLSPIVPQLLQLLPLTSPPTAIVEAIPHFVGEDPSDVSRVVEGYKELLRGDRSMLAHIIG